MAETLTIRTASSTEVVKIAVPGPQGPKGDKGDPGDVAGLPLTTQGDTLYRGASQNERLPIGTSGQVLKVSAGGIPEWGNESGAVTSVNGETGAVVLDAADVGAANASHTHVAADITDFTSAVEAVSPPADWDTLANKPATFAPTAHKNSHSIGQADFLAPSDIGAQSIFTTESLVLSTSAEVTLTAARAKIFDVLNFSGSDVDVVLPQTGNQVGDTFVFRWASGSNQILVRGVSAGSPVISLTSGERKRVIRGASNWSVVPVDTHTHAASQITSGTLTHERGGLEADVSAYNGLVKISGGSTSAVGIGTGSTEVAAGDHTHGNLTNDGKIGSTAGLPLKTGTAGAVEAGAFGTGAGEFAEGNHTHTQLHDKSHTMTDATSHTAGNHKVFYSNGSGEIVELALGNSGEVLTSNGASAAPSFAAASGGDTVSIDASAADVLTATSGAISADDGGTIDSADPFIKWDDVAGKLVYANPLSRPSGAFYVGLAPTTTALGTDAVNIQSNRNSAVEVASGSYSVAIGFRARSGPSATAIGAVATATGADATAIGSNSTASANNAQAIGRACNASAQALAVGFTATASSVNASAVGCNVTSNLRGQFTTNAYQAVYWGGQTTNATATILNLDATATNRFTIAANTALAVDILLVARRSDVADKWLVARRFLGIRRDGSNNTSLIGSVQTLGTDQTDGSPTWSFTLTADDTNEALQLEVTGAASETVQWRATAFYRVV